MYTENELAILALDSISRLEYKHKIKMLNAVKSPKELLNFDEKICGLIENFIDKSKVNTVRLCFEKDYVKKVVNSLEQKGITAITYLSSGYPECLKNISAFPLVLYCKGNIELLENKTRFGVVGSRKTLPYALKFAENLCQAVSERGGVIVTGSADGADRSAILGALDSGNVISVLAHGHDMVYPESNRELIEKVANRGLVVSEYPPSFPSRAWTFPVRNRIIAGLSVGVLIVSGEKSSGARHTANYALEYNRDVYAIPYSIGIKSGELCNYLIKNGAYLCDSEKDIITALKLDDDLLADEPKIVLDSEEKLVYDALCSGADTVNALIEKCKLKIYELAPIISSLEIKGLLVRLAGNKFRLVK